MKTLFPNNLAPLKWQNFAAEGYNTPVTGVFYSEETPATNGMPLGGIDTGCIDWETNGTLGFITAFNSLYPRRGPLNTPFLGVKVDEQTHLLSTVGIGKIKPAKSVRYWGHYPIADMEFELESSLSAGVRTWSPFIPGDTTNSMVPAAVFEVRLRNNGDKPLRGSLAASFPGFTRAESVGFAFARRPIDFEGFTGSECYSSGGYMAGENATKRMPDRPAYFLGFLGKRKIQRQVSCDMNPNAWANIDKELTPMPLEDHETSGMSVSTDFDIPAGGEETIKVLLAWHHPLWMGGGSMAGSGKWYRHMYGKFFGNAESVVRHMIQHHESLLRRIIAWQSVIYGEKKIPGWLQDSLINILHLITETAVWGQGCEGEDKNNMPDWVDPLRGLFALNECPRHCPQLECLPCSFYGNLPLVYFFPDAAVSTLYGYRAYQREDGRPAWVFGGCTVGSGPYELTSPGMGYQASLNGFCVVEMVHKAWKCTEDRKILDDFYTMCRKATEWTMSLNTSEGGVISMPMTGQSEQGMMYETEWFEAPEPGWRGMATHVGGVRLAQCQLMRAMADAVGDTAFARQCEEWFRSGAEAMEKYLWAGDYYLNFFEHQSGQASDMIFGYQLDGQWITKLHGLPDAFPQDHARITLETIKAHNVRLSRFGATNYANKDGSPAQVGGYGTYSFFTPEILMLAMTYMYEGQKEFGLQLAERAFENIACRQRLTWDQPNFFRGDIDTGERGFGADYYQNMILWSMVAALDETDIAGPLKNEGLVRRVIAAGNSKI